MNKTYLPELSQKRSGAYFTPDHVAASLAAWALRSPSDRMLDPSCGDGQFIAVHRNSVGIEQSPASSSIAIKRAPWALVHEGDFFAWAGATNERFECAAGNPPFIRYHTFKGSVRRSAFALCEKLGATFSGLASSWAPFLVATAGLLKRGGRLAFVVPAEIGHAPYAAPLLEFLTSNFSDVRIIAIREKLFPELSEDCWLLYADNYGGRSDAIGFVALDRFRARKTPPKPTVKIDLDEWRSVWNYRLRPFLLPASIRALYRSAAEASNSIRLGDLSSVGIGYVSGDNDFFHLRPSDAERWGIPAMLLHPSLRNARAMPQGAISRATVAEWKRQDDKMLLLRLPKTHDLPSAVRRYLDTSAGLQARMGYKCRNRSPWYSVPDVQVPEFVLSYMSGRTVSLVRNDAGVTCTNSLHAVRIRDEQLAKKVLPQWGSPFVRLSCELEGHALGGGMLKLEPREASRILFAPSTRMLRQTEDELTDAIGELQRWRHYAE